jgi:predicted HicB family RNase H-like nuclease
LTVEEMKGRFREPVDEYIRTCKEMGKEPQTPFKGMFNVRVKPELQQQAAIIGAKKG